MPERFKDFISTPKRNNYRSIHTTVVGPKAMRIELQIRTEAMDRVAEQGVAAHWRYKNETYGFDPEAAAAAGGSDPLANIRQLVQVLDQGGDAEDLLEHAKMEMFLDQVFVFTPKGKLISLPAGAMPLDFAYAVHTDVGDTCLGVKINGELRPLRITLQNGDVVEVIRGPKPAAAAGLAELDRERARALGHPPPLSASPSARNSSGWAGPRSNRPSSGPARSWPTSRCAQPSTGSRPPTKASCWRLSGGDGLRPTQVLEVGLPWPEGNRTRSRLRAPADRGWPGGPLLRPGRRADPGRRPALHALLQPHARRPHRRHRREGRRLAVHTIDCPVLATFEDREELWRDLQWTPEAERNTLSDARLRATVRDAPGVLGQTCTIIGEAGGNIIGINLRHRHSNFFDVDFAVEVKDARHLTHIAAALRACPSVETVDRAQG